MEPTAVSISSHTCRWRWSLKIDHRYRSSSVEVSSKNNANGGTDGCQAHRRQIRNQFTGYMWKLRCDKTQKEEMCKSQLWETFLSLSGDVLFSETAMTLQSHKQGTHKWNPFPMTCSNPNLSASLVTHKHTHWDVFFPNRRQRFCFQYINCLFYEQTNGF